MVRDQKAGALEVGSSVTLSGTVERISLNGEYAVQIIGDPSGTKRFPVSALHLTQHPEELREILRRPIEDDALFKLLKAGEATAEDQDYAAEWLRTLRAQLVEAIRRFSPASTTRP
jgi:hypothetical protein